MFWPGEFCELYSPWGCKELDMTEVNMKFTSGKIQGSQWLSGKEATCRGALASHASGSWLALCGAQGLGPWTCFGLCLVWAWPTWGWSRAPGNWKDNEEVREELGIVAGVTRENVREEPSPGWALKQARLHFTFKSQNTSLLKDTASDASISLWVSTGFSTWLTWALLIPHNLLT